jgi:riboflavin kinase/FMN adenylyltransferase
MIEHGKKRVISLGFFDGIHIGHRALIEKTIYRAKELDATPSLISFDAHPDNMIVGGKTPLINSPYDRRDIVRRLYGIDDMIFLHFDEDMMRMNWHSFLERLTDWFGAAHLIAGYDFRFGFRGEGTPEKLADFCEKNGLGCDIIEKVTLDGKTVSSTYIRSLLQDGNIREANRFLGHPHTVTDIVRYGYRLGRKIGIPTANMAFADDVLVPAHGVYAAMAYPEQGGEYRAVTNIGVRPSVSNGTGVSVESHLSGYSGDLYGHRLRIELYDYLRPEAAFKDVDALKQQIDRDIEKTIKIL